VLASAALGGSAIAQEKTTMLEEIVVTAQKRSENLQEVPIAISAYTSKTRELIGITTIQDLTNYTPGLSYSTALDRASIRGIGRNTNNLASEAGVATYADGFYNNSTTSAGSSPLQVERVEVLRGPQGTLYGRNSIGGTINIISKRPTTEFYGEGRLAYESFNRQVVEAAVSGPLADWLRVRVFAANTNQNDGYFHNVAGGPDEGGVTHANYIELQLAADFGPNVDAWLKASTYGYQNSSRNSAFVGSYDYSKIPVGFLANGAAYGILLPGSNFSAGTSETSATGITTNPALQNIRDFATNTPAKQVLSNAPTFVGHLNWHLPGVDLKYIGGFNKYNYHATTDFDGTAVSSYTVPLRTGSPAAGDFGPYCNATPGCTPVRVASDSVQQYVEDKQYYSNEINISSSGDGRLQWIAGLYQYSEEYTQPLYYPSLVPAFLTPYSIAPGAGAFGSALVTGLAPPNPSGKVYSANQDMNTDSHAAFGQVDWRFIDSLKLTLGARYTEDKRHGTESTRQICYGLSSYAYGCGDLGVYGSNAIATDVTNSLISHNNPMGTTGVATVDPITGIWSRGLKDEWHATTGTAGLEWNPNSDTALFGKYSRGYKSGGFNAGVITAAPETNPELVDAYELGAKLTLANTLQMNVAVFYYDYQGMQIPLSVTPLSGPTQTQFFNMDVQNSGAELETIWQPTSQLQLMFNYAYLTAEIQSKCDPATGEAVCLVDNNDAQAKDPQANQAGPLVPGSLGSPPSQSQSVYGQQVPQSPKNKASLNVNYRFDFSPGSLTLSASDIWKDSTYFSIFNRSYNLAPSYSQVDVRATWTDSENRYSVVAYARNLLDKEGYDGYNGGLVGNTNAIGGPQSVGETISLTPPRVFGIQVQYRIGSTK
jgi:iron complex outermembrane receptor protein